MSTTAADELAAIKDPDVREAVLRVHNHPGIPTGPLGTWALKYARWRLGDRPLYPTPPSAHPKVSIEAILRVDALVNRLVDFRPRTGPPVDVASDHHLRPRKRAADWNPLS